MKRRIFCLALTLTWLPAQAAIAGTDSFCATLEAFAASVGPAQTRGLEFHTSWGANFKGEKEAAIFAKRCDHSGDTASKAVCAFLMEHGAIEFADSNLKRAVICLSPRTRLASNLSFTAATILINTGGPDHGADVSLALSEDPQAGGMVLKVVADGY